MNRPLLSVVIPAYNEENSIEKLLGVVFSVPPKKEVIIINDGSHDRTQEILSSLEKQFLNSSPYPNVSGIKIVHKKKNEGKGAALRDGFKLASGDIVTIQDADLEVDPHEYMILLEPFEKYGADIVFGSRLLKKENLVKFSRSALYANKFLTFVSNLLSGARLTDMETCYKVFRREIIQSFSLTAKKFGIEPELAAKAAQTGKKIYEVPISYHPRTKAQGKKIGVIDGVKALGEIVKYNLFRGL